MRFFRMRRKANDSAAREARLAENRTAVVAFANPDKNSEGALFALPFVALCRDYFKYNPMSIMSLSNESV